MSRQGFEAEAEDWRLVEGKPGEDGSSGAFYWNERTQESSWERPECVDLAERSATMSAMAANAARMMFSGDGAALRHEGASESGSGHNARRAVLREERRLEELKQKVAAANPFGKQNYYAGGGRDGLVKGSSARSTAPQEKMGEE